jgi:adenylylsulfate kinase
MAITLWLTGLSASGKSTLALAAAELLVVRGIACKVIDGDELRRGPCADLGYSRADRRENIRRAAELCHLLNAADTVAIAALISPYREDREAARQIVGSTSFQEIYLATPLARRAV